MVATERAFAQASADKGTRDSFLMFIADDGILFRPTAVIGKKWLLEHPVPVTENRPLLAWQPIFADMAAAGDMGYTFGPWEFKRNINDQKAVGFGHFATVWKKQADGNWKFVIDLGISHPQSAIPATPWVPAETAKSRTKFEDVPLSVSREALLNRDRQFSEESAKQGAVAAFTKFAGEDVRLFRNDCHHRSVARDQRRTNLAGSICRRFWLGRPRLHLWDLRSEDRWCAVRQRKLHASLEETGWGMESGVGCGRSTASGTA
jgi:ketosteroid isomerase-like protein